MEWVRGEAIGRGSFGAVNLAVPKANLNRNPPLMAVKSCSVSDSASLKNEKEILSQLDGCPQIIRCFGEDVSFENGERFYNVLLEYASGGSLADRLKNSFAGGFSESDVRRYTKSVLLGLRYIHENRFVHCDVKLQNLLLCSSGNGRRDVVKIGDFGLAKRAREGGVCEKQRGFDFRGTPLYMSPEAVTGEENESPADIWALGCTVIEMLTGKPAWRCRPGSDVGALLLRIGHGEESPEIPSDLSEEGRDFLMKCFTKDPTKRGTAEMLLHHPFIVQDDDDSDNTVPLCKRFNESPSPRGPFDFPEWVCDQSSFTPSPEPVPSPGYDKWFLTEVTECSLADRIGQLVTDQRPDWLVTDSWITIRQ